jgi:hypothetical protein
LDISDVVLRIVGAFYAFAGYIATRAALTSHLLDQAIAAIALKKPSRTEQAQAGWLLTSACVILAGGILLLFGLATAAWLFLVSALMQAAYITYVAPRYFDPVDPPDAKGRRGSVNAFVVYSAATAFVLWGSMQGKLGAMSDMPWHAAAALGVIAAHLGHTTWLMRRTPRSPQSPFAGFAEDEEEHRHSSESKRIKLMAEQHAYPLWPLDPGLYADFAPEDIGLSDELARDLTEWAKAYSDSLDPESAGQSRWSEAEHAAHEAAGRALAIRLAREKPDRTIFLNTRAQGVLEVRADESI